MHTDHYQALGVAPQASAAELRAAYLRVMRESHPDRRPNDPAAEEAARRANAAWEVLGDAARRGVYDRLRYRRADGSTAHAVQVVHSHADAERLERLRPFREEGTRFRQAFHTSLLRAFAAVVALGLLLLLTVR
jgi:curved DNA-binding protein CbpA